MSEPTTAETLPVFVEIQGEFFAWSPETGLDLDVVATVERFIWREARRYEGIGQSKGLAVEDLVQEGRMGALEAARRYDPRHRANFLSYSVWRIRRAMLKALRHEPISIPEKAQVALRKTGRIPRVASLDLPVGERGNLSWVDLLPGDAPNPFASHDQAETQAWLAQALASLPDREREVLLRRYGLEGREPEALSGIAAALGFSRQRIHQIQNQAENRLKRLWSLL